MCWWLYLWDCSICECLWIWITRHECTTTTTTTHLKHLTHFPHFSWGSLNHKNLISGNSLLASALLAVGIDERSISTAGDNHSVSASTDPNSYLCLPTASMPQMTTGTRISFYCSKAPRVRMCLCASNLTFASSIGCTHSPKVHLYHRLLQQNSPSCFRMRIHLL